MIYLLEWPELRLLVCCRPRGPIPKNRSNASCRNWRCWPNLKELKMVKQHFRHPGFPGDVLLGAKQVKGIIGVSNGTFYAMRHAGDFPVPVRISKNRIGWRRSDIDRWIAERPEVNWTSNDRIVA